MLGKSCTVLISLQDDQRTNELCDVTEQIPAVGEGQDEDIKDADGGLMKATIDKGQIGEKDTKGEGQVKKDTHAGDKGQVEKKNEDPRLRDIAVTDKDQAYIINKGQAPVTDKGQAHVTDKGQMEEHTSSKDMEPEQLTITIARTEHQGNGLGISVKGKTLETAMETKDLGLFIWSILPGGAAAKARLGNKFLCFISVNFSNL